MHHSNSPRIDDFKIVYDRSHNLGAGRGPSDGVRSIIDFRAVS